MLQPQIGGLLDYIDFLRPGLKEVTSNLSAILPTIVESGLPSHKIVLETYSSGQLGELYHQSFNEWFEFCTTRNSQRSGAAAELRIYQMRAADDPQYLSPCVPISSEDLSNVMASFFDCIYSSPPQENSPDPQEVGQLSDAHVSDSLNLQSDDSHILALFDSWDIETPGLSIGCSPIPEQFDLYVRECKALSRDNAGLSAQTYRPCLTNVLDEQIRSLRWAHSFSPSLSTFASCDLAFNEPTDHQHQKLEEHCPLRHGISDERSIRLHLQISLCILLLPLKCRQSRPQAATAGGVEKRPNPHSTSSALKRTGPNADS